MTMRQFVRFALIIWIAQFVRCHPESPTSGTLNSLRWVPAIANTWQIQLADYPVDTSVNADIYIVDLFDTPEQTVRILHQQGKFVVCYFSAGTWEPWRPDAHRFPQAVIGRPLDNWPDERWLDIRRMDVLLPIMKDRIERCLQKGFDGVDPDNVDGFLHDTGFPLTPGDQIRYNRAIAALVHRYGLAVGLKNDLPQIPELVNDFDWATNEECFQYGECDVYRRFIAAGKPVVNIEYRGDPNTFCPIANRMRFFSMKKRLSLDAFRIPCR